MTSGPAFDRLLRPDPRDRGCGFVRSRLHVEADAKHDGSAPRNLDLARHLRDCRPCAEDFAVLVNVLRALHASAEVPRQAPHPGPAHTHDPQET
jgi:hypothetical protein